MAKIKFGAFLTDMRGKVGGTIFSRNKGGAYTKNKVTPLNPQTHGQQVQRQRLSAFAQAWRELTDAQRTGWNEGAGDFPLVNVFGDTYTLAGNMLYNQLNLNLAKIGAPAISEIPVPEGVGEVSLDSALVTALTLDVQMSKSIPVGQSGVFRTSTGFSAGISNFKNKLRQQEVVTSVFTDAGSILSAYEDKFGTPVVGSKIGIELVLINDTTGESGIPTKVGAVVA